MRNVPRSEKPMKVGKTSGTQANPPDTGGTSVAKEDVNVKNPGKKAKALPKDAKPKKKPGSRLMDYTG
jgi:hypothetical protein